ACKRCREFRIDAPFLIVPANERAPIQPILAEVVKFRVGGQIRQASQEGKSALQFRAAPAVPLRGVNCQIRGVIGPRFELKKRAGVEAQSFEARTQEEKLASAPLTSRRET